jgi:hypothetical protein
MAEQTIRDSGFQPVEGAPSIFQRNFDGHEVLIFVKSGRIVNVMEQVQKKNTDFFFQGGEIKLVRTYTKDSQTILMMQNERLGVRFEMDSKGDIWSTSVQLLKSLDAIDPVILGITKFAPKEELGSSFCHWRKKLI